MKRFTHDRLWGAGLILAGVAVLAVVFFSVLSIAGDPGGRYDEWVPDDGISGPEAKFDWSAEGMTVRFEDTSEAGDHAIERWFWDFGNGNESSDPNPSFRFEEGGEQGVTLEVVDAEGLTSKAEADVAVEPGGSESGEGSIGLSDMADKVTDTVERAAKGSLVVLLVIGMYLVLTVVGGRLLRQGVSMLRPVPERINMKLRPKQLDLAIRTHEQEAEGIHETDKAEKASQEEEDVRELVGTGVGSG